MTQPVVPDVVVRDPEVIHQLTRKFPGTPPKPPEQAAPAESLVTVRPTESLPEAKSIDPSATTLFLPSRSEFYHFSSVSIKRPTGFHQAKFFRAAKEESDRHMTDAITTLLPEGIRADELTIPDFYFILYWLRLNCYTRTDLIHDAVCTNPAHREEVKNKTKPPESLRQMEVVTRTSIETIDLPKDYMDGFEEDLKTLAIYLAPLGFTVTAPRMFDVIELSEEYSDNENFTEIAFLADRAGCLMAADGQRTTLRERIQVVEKMDIDLQSILEEWRVRCSSYGVRESIKFKCKGCGANVENKISISAHSFL